jgi:hypothetical protein
MERMRRLIHTLRQSVTSKPRCRSTFIAIAIAVAAIALVSMIIVGPEYLIAGRKFALSPIERLDAESSIRGSLIQIVGGLILVAGLYFTATGFRLTREVISLIDIREPSSRSDMRTLMCV